MLDLMNVKLSITINHVCMVNNNSLQVVLLNNSLTIDDKNNQSSLPQVSLQSVLDNFCEYYSDNNKELLENLEDIKNKLEQEII